MSRANREVTNTGKEVAKVAAATTSSEAKYVSVFSSLSSSEVIAPMLNALAQEPDVLPPSLLID